MKINIHSISFWFDRDIEEKDLEGDFESTEHFFENHLSCWCKPQVIYTDPVTNKKVVLHRKLEH